MKNRKLVFDALLIGFILISALLAHLIISAGSADKAAVCVVRINKSEYAVLPLDEDRVLNVAGELTVVVKDKEVCVKNPSCPDKLCEKQGRISKPGEVIACLPGKVTVEITSEEYDFLH